jgi:hypothetical protein
MRVPTALVACSFALVGCLNVTSTRIGPPSLGYDRPLLAPDEVAVYRTEEQVPGEYQEVALLHVTGSETWSTESGVYRKLREEAGRLGANAVILQPVRELSNREKIVARSLNLDMGREGRAIAIYVLPPKGVAAGAGANDSLQPDPAAGPPASARRQDAFYSLLLEDSAVLPARGVEPAGIGQIKVIHPDGTVRYLTSNRVQFIRDRDGRDWTKWVLEERRRLPVTTALF